MRIRLFTILAALVLGLGLAASAQAQTDEPVPYRIVPRPAPTTHVDVAQLPPAGVANFDAEKATDAYMARISPTEKARSDAYFEGGYFLLVVDLFYTLIIAGLLLWLKVSSRMREFATAITRHRWLQAPIYVVQYIVLTTLLSSPLAIYEGFVREHHYELSNQTFWQWAGEFAINFGLELVALTVLLTIIYAVVRATKHYWWVWGRASRSSS